MQKVLDGKNALLLDMNSTFMFGEDRFGENEDYSVYYHSIGGKLDKHELHQVMTQAFDYLAKRYPDEAYRHCFPSVETAFLETLDIPMDSSEVDRLIATFSYHEQGIIPAEFVEALHQLAKHFRLAAVVDIWSPSIAWRETFRQQGIEDLFGALSFSSDHGCVKPSPRPFMAVLEELAVHPKDALMIGDSVRRDLGGARAANIDCILVGGQEHPDALATFSDLLAFRDAVEVFGRSVQPS
ncbi:HAD family hydrolase [Hahella ganghwensis]|uniref:HAD family hydrolase n=1 Tax=Hahella ganghwensis TaxID=286420 RepID=UPI0003672394|nr:HAD family hydrolase [Hahella ganghwensis]